VSGFGLAFPRGIKTGLNCWRSARQLATRAYHRNDRAECSGGPARQNARKKERTPGDRRHGRADLGGPAFAPLGRGEVDCPQHAGRSCRLDDHTTINLIGQAVRHEREEVGGAGLDRVQAEVGELGGSDGRAADV